MLSLSSTSQAMQVLYTSADYGMKTLACEAELPYVIRSLYLITNILYFYYPRTDLKLNFCIRIGQVSVIETYPYIRKTAMLRKRPY
jgi:hypothetical protein